MRILQVTAGYLPDAIGGVELHLEGLAAWMAGRGHEILIFRRGADPDRPEYDLDEYTHQGVRVVRVNNTFAEARRFMDLLVNEPVRRRFAEVAEPFRPDLVHVHHLTCLTAQIVDECTRRDIPVVMSLHDFWMGCPRGQRLTSALSPCPMIEERRCRRCYAETWPGWCAGGGAEDDDADAAGGVASGRLFELYHARIRETLDQARLLIVPSAFSEGIYESYGVPARRLRIIPYGIDADRYRPGRPPAGGARTFGYIGTLLPSKGVHVLIDAFRRLDDERLCLEIHGPDLPYHNDPRYGERLRRMARGLEDRIRFHGRYENEELAGILERLDVLVAPSIWFETWGIVVREAFLGGVPVVVSDFGALREGVDPERTGLVFRRGDAADLARQMRRLAGEPGLLERLARAPKTVPSVAQNAVEVEAAYRTALEG